MTTALVAIGSNLGDRFAHVSYALLRLSKLRETEVTAVSALYETAPVGGPDGQGRFLNAAVRMETELAAAAILTSLLEIEAERERVRKVRWDARTLDLDLLTWGECISEDPELTLPHPRLQERRFVMVPVCDIAADLIHPSIGRPMSALLAALPAEPGDLSVFDASWGSRTLPHIQE